VVEYFFLWPGVGLLILEAIRADMPTLVTDSIVCLGIFFLVVNLLLDMVTPVLDPRLRRWIRQVDIRRSGGGRVWAGLKRSCGRMGADAASLTDRGERDAAPFRVRRQAVLCWQPTNSAIRSRWTAEGVATNLPCSSAERSYSIILVGLLLLASL
jgi:hypothetical protein